MQYDLTIQLQRHLFEARCKALLDKGCVVNLSEKTFRSKSQNNYLHLLIGVVAMETGNTLSFTKEVYFKKLVNPDIFCVFKDDKIMGKAMVNRSSADLTPEEMSMAIDRFIRWGSENGIYMPSPGDKSILREIEIEMGRMKSYLGG